MKIIKRIWKVVKSILNKKFKKDDFDTIVLPNNMRIKCYSGLYNVLGKNKNFPILLIDNDFTSLKKCQELGISVIIKKFKTLCK